MTLGVLGLHELVTNSSGLALHAVNHRSQRRRLSDARRIVLSQRAIRVSQLAQSQTRYPRVDQHANPRHAAGRARTQGSLTKHSTFESLTLALVGGHCTRYAHMKLLPAPPTRLAAKIRRLSQNARNKYVNASVLATGYLVLQRILASR